MQRRTNLFYTTGNDSKFITFSNYTEALTGNFLATDWKMFPSKFICMYIPELLDAENKKLFIQSLVAYYENKLAFIRDYNINHNLSVEENMKPLAWLFEAIYKHSKDSGSSSSCSSSDDCNGIHSVPEITFVGNINEQNYNGVYADTICTIDGTVKPYKYKLNENEKTLKLKYDFSSRYLYGWYTSVETEESVIENYTGLNQYKNVLPGFDEVISDDYDEENKSCYYTLDSQYSSITKESIKSDSFKFNIIIPIFDCVNINYETNINNINEEIDLMSEFTAEAKLNIPLGIWFADEVIELRRDNQTEYAPSWSLVLSSQFKPLPYSDKITNEGESYTSNAFGTFAQVISRQNNIIDSFESLSNQLSNLNNRLYAIETKLNNIGSSAALDGMHKEFIKFKRSITNLVNTNNEELKNEIASLEEEISELKETN